MFCPFSWHESFIHFDTVGLDLGDECIFTCTAAKMFCWNPPDEYFVRANTPPLMLEWCLGSLWRNTDMNPPQEVVRSPRQQPQPDSFFFTPLPEAAKQWNKVGWGRNLGMWETMRWQNHVRNSSRAPLEQAAGECSEQGEHPSFNQTTWGQPSMSYLGVLE